MSKKNIVITEDKAYARMARICSRKEYSPFDIEQKLYRLDLSKETTDKIINQLKSNNYLNEERYVRSFIKDKLLINKWGRRKIEAVLFQKRLPQNIVNSVFLEYDRDELSENLMHVLEKKWKSVKGNSDYEKKCKLIKYALSRGFEMNDILSCMNRMKIGEIELD